jgi:magnesium transporter
MDVRFVGTGGIEEHSVGHVASLLGRSDGFVWIDVPVFDADVELLLVEGFQAHPRLIEACRTRNHVPSVHSYEAHFFTILHAPLLGEAGHVHLLEIDQIVGHNFIVTVHGPINPVVDPAEMLVETDGVLRRIERGKFRPTSPAELSYAVGSAIARRQRAVIGDVAEKLPALEARVMAPSFREPEELLEQMFLVRHELTTARTMAAQSHDVYARITTLERYVPEADRGFARDLADQFDKVRSVGDGEAQFLHGVIELYQTRVHTKMTVAMERLAVIAAVTLPITAVASIYGMNVIASDNETRPIELAIVVAVMAAMSWWLLTWTRRQGWW